MCCSFDQKVPSIAEEQRGGREARPLRDFMEHEYAVDANLRPEEILVGRLYTGCTSSALHLLISHFQIACPPLSLLAAKRVFCRPMYHKYNRVVRTDVEKLWSGEMNTYTTTLYVLTSLLMKLSRVSRIPRPWKVLICNDMSCSQNTEEFSTPLRCIEGWATRHCPKNSVSRPTQAEPSLRRFEPCCREAESRD